MWQFGSEYWEPGHFTDIQLETGTILDNQGCLSTVAKLQLTPLCKKLLVKAALSCGEPEAELVC